VIKTTKELYEHVRNEVNNRAMQLARLTAEIELLNKIKGNLEDILDNENKEKQNG